MPPKVTDIQPNADQSQAVEEETALAARRIVATYAEDFLDGVTLMCMLGVEPAGLIHRKVLAEQEEAAPKAAKKATKTTAKKATKKAVKKATKTTAKKATKTAAKKATKTTAKKATKTAAKKATKTTAKKTTKTAAQTTEQTTTE